jgi:non-haem Fe2+, alpha-ketoglutarate-dependent halogenase
VKILPNSKPEFKLIIDNLKKYGFSNGIGFILTTDELIELEQIIDKLHADPKIRKDYSSNAPVITSLAGRNDRLDFFLEKILTSKQVKEVLGNVLGAGYKVWQINSRISENGDKGLGLHQDSFGETNLSFLVSARNNADGMTAFLPKSHLILRWAKSISWSNIKLARYFITPLKGVSGECAFFFNKTWHARLPNYSGASQKVILISLFPVGSFYTPDMSMVNLKHSPRYPELEQLLSVDDGVIAHPEGRFEVARKTTTNAFCYAAQIEKSTAFSCGAVLLYLQIFLLELFFRPIFFSYHFFKDQILVSSKKT